MKGGKIYENEYKLKMNKHESKMKIAGFFYYYLESTQYTLYI